MSKHAGSWKSFFSCTLRAFALANSKVRSARAAPGFRRPLFFAAFAAGMAAAPTPGAARQAERGCTSAEMAAAPALLLKAPSDIPQKTHRTQIMPRHIVDASGMCHAAHRDIGTCDAACTRSQELGLAHKVDQACTQRKRCNHAGKGMSLRTVQCRHDCACCRWPSPPAHSPRGDPPVIHHTCLYNQALL